MAFFTGWAVARALMTSAMASSPARGCRSGPDGHSDPWSPAMRNARRRSARSSGQARRRSSRRSRSAALGQKRTSLASDGNVRCYLESGHRMADPRCRLRAITDSCAAAVINSWVQPNPVAMGTLRFQRCKICRRGQQILRTQVGDDRGHKWSPKAAPVAELHVIELPRDIARRAARKRWNRT